MSCQIPKRAKICPASGNKSGNKVNNSSKNNSNLDKDNKSVVRLMRPKSKIFSKEVSFNNKSSIITTKDTISQEKIDYINNSLYKIKIDPILCVMKEEPMLYEFYKERINEVLTDAINGAQEEEIRHLKEENTKLKQTLENVCSKLNESTLILSSLTSENENYLSKISETEEKLSKKTRENKLLISQLNDIHLEINQKSDEIFALKKGNSKLIKDIEKMKGEAAENLFVKEENVRLEAEIRRLNSDLNDCSEKIEEMQRNLEEREREFREKEEKFKEKELDLNIKIQAIKNKLKEKIDLISELTENRRESFGGGEGEEERKRSGRVREGVKIEEEKVG